MRHDHVSHDPFSTAFSSNVDHGSPLASPRTRPLVLATAAAVALACLYESYSDEPEFPTLVEVVRMKFATAGVSFDDAGRPITPSVSIDALDGTRLHASAVRAAYVALSAAAHLFAKRGTAVDDLELHAFFDAFNAGAFDREDTVIGGRAVTRGVHGVDLRTRRCLGGQGI